MPELPEVETVRRSLESHLVGKMVTGIDLLLERILKKPEPKEFCGLLTNKKITAMDRRGKYLLIRLEGNYTWVIHLRMTGQLIYTNEKMKHKHLRLAFHLNDGNWLNFIDMRTFGSMYLLPDDRLGEITCLATMGPEPLDKSFYLEELSQKLSKRRGALKAVLLDQSVVAGLGNIYVDEALFEAKIDPRREAATLKENEVAQLHKAIIKVLEKAVTNRGTTFRDYLDGAGKKGSNQQFLNVYQRSGEPCVRCGTEISKIRVGGRGTSYCSKCQG